jgi:predicted amidohydrolase YtcJ
MIDEGVVVAGGSDYPYCEFYQTFYNLHAAINRQDLSGYPKEGWLPEEKLSVDEAVSIFTKGPEYASYEEDIKGAIEKGKLADCFLISDDIYTIDSSKIKDLFVELTLMDGKIVYKK